MTKEELAALLNGREYGSEITSGEKADARRHGLLVIHGYSDDNAELCGAFDDEVGCYDGGTLYLHRNGVLGPHEDGCDCAFCGYEKAAAKSVKLEAIWGKEGYSWTYKTAIPHASFDIMEDGEKYCRGIVVSVSDLPTL